MKTAFLILALMLTLGIAPAVTRTARGSANSKTSGSSLAVGSVVIASGTTIIVVVADLGDQAIIGITWGLTSLVIDAQVDNTGNVRTTIASAYIPTGATSTLTVSYAGNTLARSAAVDQVAGLLPGGALDVIATRTGSGVNVSSGATVTTAQAAEFWIGSNGINGPTGDSNGTCQNSFSDGQRDGTTGGADTSNITITECFQVVAATGAATDQLNGITSRAWAAAVATYKAQTCVPQSVAWVAETVAANVSGVFDDATKPFGLQAAFRDICVGAEIRPLAGTNNYNHLSASWLGRDGSPTVPTIKVDTVSGDIVGTGPPHGAAIRVVGYADTMTPCAFDNTTGLFTPGCPVTIDFDQGFTAPFGGEGFVISKDYYVWSFIRSTNSRYDAWNAGNPGNYNVWYRCRGDHAGNVALGNNAFGFNVTGAVIASQADTNTLDGFGLGYSAPAVGFPASFNYVAYSVSFGNTRCGILANQDAVAVNNSVWSNSSCGFAGTGTFIGNTSRSSGLIAATPGGMGHLLFNIFTTGVCKGCSASQAGGLTISQSTTDTYDLVSVLFGNNYGNNTHGNVSVPATDPTLPATPGVMLDVDGVYAAAEDVSTITFVGAADATPTGGTANVDLNFDGPILSTFQKGAIQIRATTIVVTGGKNYAF